MDAYQDTLDWLYAIEKAKGIELKLERVADGMRLLGDPQDRLRCIHVAGTNGKGSVVAFLGSILGAAGYSVGLYTSPHLVRLTERIRIGPHEIDRPSVVDLVAEVRARVIDAGVMLTFFEVLTAIAFLYFERAGVDCAVIEVGLGGRLDATNLVDPLASAIVSVGRDHTRFLGESTAQIATEKAGVIKPGRPVVVGRLDDDAARVVRGVAAERDAPSLWLGHDFDALSDNAGFMRFSGLGEDLDGLALGLRGRHQIDNAAVAVALLLASSESLPVGEPALRSGLADTRWPGRLEIVSDQPRLILDGAHNVDAMRALVAELQRSSLRPVCVLFAAMGDKEWREMIEILGPHCARAVVTEVAAERAVPAATLAEAFRSHCPVEAETDPVRAIQRLRDTAEAEDILLATGSLFLVGKVHEILGERPGRSD